MADVKKYIWILPLLGAILAFITLFAPAVSMNLLGMLTDNLWLWGLYIYNFSGFISGTEFITEPLVLIPSLIVTILIALSGVLLFLTAIKLKKRSFKLRTVRNISLISGVVILVSEIIWIIMIPIFFDMAYYWDSFLTLMPYTFWTWNAGFISLPLHNAGFGIYGGFLSAAIALGGAGAAHYYSKEREATIPKEQEIIPKTKEPIASETPKLKFCQECGTEIEDPDVKFCGKCGFEFKSPELAPL